jgi:hypothetical protein
MDTRRTAQPAALQLTSLIFPRRLSDAARSFSHDSIVVVLVTSDHSWKSEKMPTAMMTGMQAV